MIIDTPSTPPTDSAGADLSNSDTKESALERALNRVVSMNTDLARRHVERFGGGKSGPALLRRLDRQYRLTVAGSGAAAGAAAVVPGLGTAASLALSGGQTVATLQATMLYVLSYAQATGVQVDDVDRRRVLLMAVLLGESGQQLVEKILGNGDKSWLSLMTDGAPQDMIKQLNRQLRGRFLSRFGVAQVATSLARMLPFGAGVAVGGIAGAASSSAVIKTTRKVFDV